MDTKKVLISFIGSMLFRWPGADNLQNHQEKPANFWYDQNYHISAVPPPKGKKTNFSPACGNLCRTEGRPWPSSWILTKWKQTQFRRNKQTPTAFIGIYYTTARLDINILIALTESLRSQASCKQEKKNVNEEKMWVINKCGWNEMTFTYSLSN